MTQTNEVIASRLKTLRRLKGLSQSEVAKRLNVHPSTISNYESAKRTVPPELIYALADLYDTTADDLLKPVSTSPRSTRMHVLKAPLPLHAPGLPLKILLVGGILGLLFTLVLESDLLLGWSLILLIVYGVALSIVLHQTHRREATYYSVKEDQTPVYRLTHARTEVKKVSWYTALFAAMVFLFLFFMEGFVLTTLTDVLKPSDELGLSLFFTVMGAGLVILSVQGFTGRLLRMEIENIQASPTLGTLHLIIMKGIIIAGYAYHMVIVRESLLMNESPIHPVLLVLMIHLPFILMYLLFHGIHAVHQHYKLELYNS